MSAWLASDLHLPPEPSPLREGFLRWLDAAAANATAVYLLGDIFDAWLGDDLGALDYPDELRALRRLVDGGVPVYVMVGNRDFLLGDAFVTATGAQLLPDPCIAELGGRPTLLSHGDQWCWDDVGYQRYRRVVHWGWLQTLFRASPRRWRAAVARRLRGHSRQATPLKADDILDVSPAAIDAALRWSGVDRIIHGHTHRPDHHHLTVDGRACERVVLPDWTTEHMGGLRIESDDTVRAQGVEPLCR